MTPSHVRECLASLRDELYELALDLVRTPSVTGDEDAAQETLAARFRDWGLDVDLWTVEPSLTAHRAYCDDGLPVERQNLVARWGEPRETAALILNGHIDVVPPGERERWDADPFDARIHQDVLHGRGSCDMKGGLAACCIAVRAAMKLGITPKRPILIQSVIGEETGGLGTLAAIERGYRADGAVIAEPTSLHMCPVQAGALSFTLHVRGKAAHGAMRGWGVSAVEKIRTRLCRSEIAIFVQSKDTADVNGTSSQAAPSEAWWRTRCIVTRRSSGRRCGLERWRGNGLNTKLGARYSTR